MTAVTFTGESFPVSVTQIQAHESRTDKYRFISTKEIIEYAKELGWYCHSGKQAGVRDINRHGYQKHMVIMQQAFGSLGIDGKIQLVIRNSHNGGGGLHIFLGYMRTVCSNQFYAKDFGNGLTLTVRHTEKGFNEFLDFMGELPIKIQEFSEQIRVMNRNKLTDLQVANLARQALCQRFSKDKVTDELIQQALVIDREEDKENTAWNVINRVQEKMLNGGLFMINPDTGKVRKSRKIKGIDTLVTINSNLLAIASAI